MNPDDSKEEKNSLKPSNNSLEPFNDNNDNGKKEVRGERDVAEKLAKQMVFETNKQVIPPRKPVSLGDDELGATITSQGGDHLFGDPELIKLHLLSKAHARSKSSDSQDSSQDSDGNGSGVFGSFFKVIKNIFVAPDGNNLQQDSTSRGFATNRGPAIVDETTFNPISPSQVEEILYGDLAPRHQSDKGVKYDSGSEGFEGESSDKSVKDGGDKLSSDDRLSFNNSFGGIEFLRSLNDNSVSYSVLDASQILLKMIKNFIRFIIISCASCNEETNESFKEQYKSLLDQIKNLNEKIGIFKDRQEDYEDLICAFLSFESSAGKVKNISKLWDKIIQNESKDYISNDDICDKIKIYQNLCLLRNSLNFLVNNLKTEEIMTPNNCVYIEECEENFIILASRFNYLIKDWSNNHQKLENCRSQINDLAHEVAQDLFLEGYEKGFGAIGEIANVSRFEQYAESGYKDITAKQKKGVCSPPLSPSSWSAKPVRKEELYPDKLI